MFFKSDNLPPLDKCSLIVALSATIFIAISLCVICIASCYFGDYLLNDFLSFSTNSTAFSCFLGNKIVPEYLSSEVSVFITENSITRFKNPIFTETVSLTYSHLIQHKLLLKNENKHHSHKNTGIGHIEYRPQRIIFTTY